jgi:hypothetical protein
MIEITIDSKQIHRAEKLYEFKCLKGSITKGKSQIYGAIGEIMCFDYLSELGNINQESSYDYDLVFDSFKIDVKTKCTTVIPLPDYLASISDFNPRQKCDWYLFCRVHKNMQKGWICGFIWKLLFYKKAQYAKKDDIDPDGKNWTFKGDCYNIKYGDLMPIELLKSKTIGV